MLPFVVIRQDILKKWAGKIDPSDAMILGLIRSMDLRSPYVRALSYRGFVLLRRAYVKEMLPLLDVCEAVIGRRLKNLSRVGLVDILLRVDKKTRKYNLYVKLSKLYWAAERAVETTRESLAVDEFVHGRKTFSSTDGNVHISSKDESVREEESGVASPPVELAPPDALAASAVPTLAFEWSEEAHNATLTKLLAEAKRLGPVPQLRSVRIDENVPKNVQLRYGT